MLSRTYKLAAFAALAAVTLAGCSGGKQEGDDSVTAPASRSVVTTRTTTSSTPTPRTTVGTGVGDPTNQELLDAINASNADLTTKVAAAKDEAMAAKDKATAAETAAKASEAAAKNAEGQAKKAKNKANAGFITGLVGAGLGLGGLVAGIWGLNRSKDQGEQTRKMVDEKSKHLGTIGAANLAASSAAAANSGVGAIYGHKNNVLLTEESQKQGAERSAAGAERTAQGQHRLAVTPIINKTSDDAASAAQSGRDNGTLIRSVKGDVASVKTEVGTVATKVETLSGEIKTAYEKFSEANKSYLAAIDAFDTAREEMVKADAETASALSKKIDDASKAMVDSSARLEAASKALIEKTNGTEYETLGSYILEGENLIIRRAKKENAVVEFGKASDKGFSELSDDAKQAEIAVKLHELNKELDLDAGRFLKQMIDSKFVTKSEAEPVKSISSGVEDHSKPSEIVGPMPKDLDDLRAASK